LRVVEDDDDSAGPPVGATADAAGTTGRRRRKPPGSTPRSTELAERAALLARLEEMREHMGPALRLVNVDWLDAPQLARLVASLAAVGEKQR
jgi:hypothetical protein